MDWSPHFRARFAGRPLKRLAIRFGPDTVRGEAMITESGLEGGVIYALSARLRDAIEAEGPATISLDLRPDLSQAVLEDRLGGPRRSQSLANTLRKQAGLAPEAIGLVQEALHGGRRRRRSAAVDQIAAGPPGGGGADRAGDFVGRRGAAKMRWTGR